MLRLQHSSGAPAQPQEQYRAVVRAGIWLHVFGAKWARLDTFSARARPGFQSYLRQLKQSFDVLEQAHFAVIAAIQGGCIGGAPDLATASGAFSNPDSSWATWRRNPSHRYIGRSY